MAKGPRPTLRLIDRLVLVVAWLATSAVVYVLGYYVGKGTPNRQVAAEERTVRLPVTSPPPPEGQRPKEQKEFPSFYEALPAGERPIDVARGTTVTAPPAATVPTRPRPTTTVASATTTLVRATTTLPRATTSVPAATLPPTTAPRPATTSLAPTTTVPRAPVPTTTLVRTTATVPRATTPPATIVPRTASRGGYTVEASPTRSRSEAEQLQGTLRRRGYDATIVQVERDGDTWYRLRVGRYASAEQATDTMRRLRDVEGVTHVFVATD